MSIGRRSEQTSVTQTYHPQMGLAPKPLRLWDSRGKAPNRWAISCNFLQKIPVLMRWNHISHNFRAI